MRRPSDAHAGAITDERAIAAASALDVDLTTLTYPKLIALTRNLTGRQFEPRWQYRVNRAALNLMLVPIFQFNEERVVDTIAGVTYVNTSFANLPVPPAAATTVGGYVFVNDESLANSDPLTAHEYIHVLYEEASGLKLVAAYGINLLRFSGSDPRHPYESLGYLWEGYIAAYGNKALGSKYGDNQPWCTFRPAVSDPEPCP